MRSFLFGICLILIPLLSYAQPGIYTEDDMMLHSKFMEAQTAKYLDKPDQVISILTDLLQLDRTCDACHYEMAMAYQKMENWEKAESSIAKALKVQPKNQGYLEAASAIYKSSKNGLEQINVLKNLISINPSDHKLKEQLVYVQLQEGQDDDALQTIEQLDRSYGPYEKTTTWKLKIYRERNDQNAQIEAVKKLVNAFPDNTRFLNNLASMYKEMGKDRLAQQTYQQVLDIDPENSTANMATISKDLGSKDDSKFLKAIMPLIENESIDLDEKIKQMIPYVQKMGNDPASEENVQLMKVGEKLIAMHPTEAKVYALRADLYYNTGKFIEAEDDYKKTIELNKGISDVWSQRMRNLVQLEDYDNLKSISSKAVDLFPLQFDPYFYNALSLIKAGDAGSAKAQIAEAAFIAVGDDYKKAQIDYLSALMDFYDEKYNDVQDKLKAYTSKQLPEFLIYELLGDASAKSGNTDGAVKMWRLSQQMGNGASTLLKKISEKKFVN